MSVQYEIIFIRYVWNLLSEMITTVLLDLFGTLVRLGTNTNPYLTLSQRSSGDVRQSLHLSLVNDCPTLNDYANLINLEPQNDINLLEDGLRTNLRSVTVFDDTVKALEVLNNNGKKLVLVSNLATPYKKVVEDLDLIKYFNAIVYSCDCKMAKPDVVIYQYALSLVKLYQKRLS